VSGRKEAKGDVLGEKAKEGGEQRGTKREERMRGPEEERGAGANVTV
jgi:hypothetical protein